jgi:hypothetical protein
MKINNFIDSISNELFNKIRNSKSDAEARRILKASIVKNVCTHIYKPCKQEVFSHVDKCVKCLKIK